MTRAAMQNENSGPYVPLCHHPLLSSTAPRAKKKKDRKCVFHEMTLLIVDRTEKCLQQEIHEAESNIKVML